MTAAEPQFTLTPALEEKISALAAKYESVQQQLSDPDVRPGSEQFLKLSKQAAQLVDVADGFTELRRLRRELAELRELALEEPDPELRQLAAEEALGVAAAEAAAQHDLLLGLLPTDEADERSVVLEVRAGVGGDWAADFAADLLGMYSRYAGQQGWRFELLDQSNSDFGGVKSASALISGAGAYAALRYEGGVHRAQAVPFTEKAGRMQTGTATVVVLPEADEVDVRINESDIRVDTYRSSGSGGQHVNTTDSAVRLTHVPSGLVVACQTERSQHQNRAQALRVLRSKLAELEASKVAAAQQAQRQASIGRGTFNERIRTYNYQDGRVTDHRSGLTVQGGVDKVLGADRLPDFIAAMQQQRRAQQLGELLAGEVGA